MKDEIKEFSFTTTLDSGEVVSTMFEGTAHSVAALHSAQVTIARERAAVLATVGGDQSLPALCSSLNRLTLACTSMAHLVGDSVSVWNVVDLDVFPRVGPAPLNRAISAVAWNERRVLCEYEPGDAKIGPWRVVERAALA